MAVPIHNFVWQQGEDGQIQMTITDSNNVAVNLTGYSLRMDVRAPGSSNVLYTFNSNDSDGATVDEATLGSDGSINIVVPRSVTLAAGALYGYINQLLNYDIFLRDTTNLQRKLIEGTIKFEPSLTLWA